MEPLTSAAADAEASLLARIAALEARLDQRDQVIAALYARLAVLERGRDEDVQPAFAACQAELDQLKAARLVRYHLAAQRLSRPLRVAAGRTRTLVQR